MKNFPTFHRKLLAWYADSARDLPWRRTHDPYRIWISEIMLQQTTVVAVIPYFERFLARFPSVDALAAADETNVLRLWEGLGYYSRAKNLLRAAKAVVEKHHGQFPSDIEVLQTLPGIGRYTAGAIASFAFDIPAPIVEANTLRLYCRLLGYQSDPRSSVGQKVLWTFAEAVLPKTGPGRLNQALMELGATVCIPKEPRCGICPVSAHCHAFRDGTQSVVPQQKSKKVMTAITEVSIAIRRGPKYLLRRCPLNERWAGLWDFLRFEIAGDSKSVDTAHLTDTVRERTGLIIECGSQIAELKHAVTRYRITLKCITAIRQDGRLKSGNDWKWVKPADFQKYPLSVTGRRFAELLQRDSM